MTAAVQHRSAVRRFASAEVEPERSVGLLPNHPALSEGRTIFPSSVTASKDSLRFLVSGHNNPKLGKAVLKGERKGWPIYHLSLEERATCPSSCLQWASCYGNAMPYSRRHTPDSDFERYLIAEVITVARQHPEGLLVRLHSLGDFYSVEYVYIWASLMREFPQLHVFGYTAHCTDNGDEESRRIARALEVVTDGAWNRFAIRTSGGVEARSVTVVADDAAEAAEMTERGIIMCPAQTNATEACASCGLCWVESARDKAIGFLRHGMKAKPPRLPKPANDEAVVPPAAPQLVAEPAPTPAKPARARTDAKSLPARTLELLQQRGTALKAVEIAEALKVNYVDATKACVALHTLGVASWGWGQPTTGRKSKLLSLIDAKPDPAVAVPAKAIVPVRDIPIRTKVQMAPSADDLPEPEVKSSARRTLIGRKPGECAYPVNAPEPGQGATTLYCCAPVAGKLHYCADHAKAMFMRRPK